MNLRHGNLFPRKIPLVELPRGLHHQQSPDRDIMCCLAKFQLDRLTINQPHAEAFAVFGIVRRNRHATLRQTEPAHAMRQTGRAKPDLRHLEAVAHLHQYVVVRNFEPVKGNLAVPAMFFRSHDRNTPHNVPARLIPIKQKRRQPFSRIVGCAGDQNEMLRFRRTRNIPFATMDRPSACLPLRPCLDHRRVGSATRRGLRHGEGRADLAIDNRLQPALFLCLGADAGQNTHIPVIGSRAIHRHRPEQAVIGFLVKSGATHNGKPHAAPRHRRLRRPQSRLFGMRSECLEPVQPDILMRVEIRRISFERNGMVVHKSTHSEP